MSTSTVATIVTDYLNNLTSILYGVIPDILVAVAIFTGIYLGIRYVRHWVFGSAR